MILTHTCLPAPRPSRTPTAIYIAGTLKLVDYSAPEANAAAIVQFETEIAKVSWSQTKRRDIAATYNPISLVALEAVAPGVSWRLFLKDSVGTASVPIVLSEDSAVVAIADLYAQLRWVCSKPGKHFTP
jgi:putative endopeptidase